jgi:hypothetical protein
MATQVQFRRGTTAQNASFTGALGEVTVDTDKDTLVVHDGGTAGGFEISRADASNLKFPDGAVGTPAISFASDTNTGIYRGGTDILKFVTAGTDAVTIDASQNTTFAGTATMDGLTVDNGEMLLDSATQAFLKIDRGAISHYALTRYYTGGTEEWRTGTYNDETSNFYIATPSSTHLSITSGGDISFYEDTGTTAKLFWDASEEALGIGTSSPSKRLHLYATNDDASVRFENTASAKVWDITPARPNVANTGLSIYNVTDDRTDLHIDNNGNVGIGTSSPTSQNGKVLHIHNSSGATDLRLTNNTTGTAFGNGTILTLSSLTAYLYNYENADFVFGTDATEAMRIDSNQNLLVGLTSESLWQTEAGCTIRPTGAATFTRDSNPPVLVNLLGSDTNLISFYKDNSVVGSIGVSGGRPFYGADNGSTGSSIQMDSLGTIPRTRTGGSSDGTFNLGASGSRWKDLYLSGGVVLDDNPTAVGGDVTSKTLDDYEEGTCTFTYTGSSGNPTVTYDSVSYGFYTKIGRKVFIEGRIRTDAFSGGSGSLQVSGLPFTVSNIDPNKYTSGGGIVSNDFGSNQPHSTMAIAGTTSFYCIYGNYNINNVSDCQNGTNKNQIQFSFFYMAI